MHLLDLMQRLKPYLLGISFIAVVILHFKYYTFRLDVFHKHDTHIYICFIDLTSFLAWVGC